MMLAKPEHKITIEKWSEHARGSKRIMVDGLQWGSIFMESCGSHGVCYWFANYNPDHTTHWYGFEICDPKNLDYRKNPRRFEIREGRWYRRQNETAPPIADRLQEKVTELVARGLLKHPDVLKQERTEANRIWSEEVERGNREKEAEFRKHAVEAVQSVRSNVYTIEEIVDRVVAAMKWAQTQ